MSEKKTYRLGDICKNVCSGGTPKSTNPLYYDGDIPWLNTKEIDFNRISSTQRCITQEGLENSSAKWIDACCVIVAMYGATAGKVAINTIPLTTNQACCNLSIDENIADYKYVYYYLCAHYFELASLANGGAQQNLNAQQIKAFEISLPPLLEQKRIAGILSALDDKIELNCRINANLEAQAMALYKQWFVDGRQEDWVEKKLGDFFDVITGKKDANFATKDGIYPFFSCSQAILKAPDYSFDGAAILVAGNGDFNVKRYIGKFEAYQRTYVLIPYESKYHAFLYLLMKYHLLEITGGSRGSVIKFITKGNIADFAFTLPAENIDEKLKVLNDLFDVVDCNKKEIDITASVRDILLQKLMQGL